MNHKFNCTLSAFALSCAMLLSACSGNKHQNHDQEKEGDQMAEMKAEAPSEAVTEVKAFDQVDASVKAQINGFHFSHLVAFFFLIMVFVLIS